MTGSTVAFVCAMPMELRPLEKLLKLDRTELGDGPAWKGSLDGREVIAVVTGMGSGLAAKGMARLFREVTPERVVIVGITGAVDNETVLGTLVLPERVVDAATGREHRHVPLVAGEPRGVLWTTDVITTAEELPALRERGVVALDMETATIAHACEERDVPWTVVRAYSDRASDGSVDDELFRLSNQDGTPNPRKVLQYFLRHPGRIPRLMRMGKSANLATRRAAEAAIAAVRALD